MVSPVSPTFQSVQHDKQYYIKGGDLVVLVENIFFRVHRYFFERESVFFQTLLNAPQQENEPEPGTSDSTAIMLDASASQFSRFVWVFYNPKLSLYDEASLEDWKSILELSHRWFFPEVKQLAIRELQKQPLSPVQRIELYHKNDVDRNYLMGDYIELCQRPQPLNLKEGLDLGLETTLMIAQAREEIRTPRSPEGVMTPLTPTLQGPELIGLIGKMFVASGDSINGGGIISNGTATTGATGQQQQPTTRPVITINGVPEPKGSSLADVKSPKAATQGGTNGRNSGGSVNKTDKQNQSKNQSKNQPKNQSKNQSKKENQQESPTEKPKETTTTTSQTAEAKKAGVANSEERKDKDVSTPVAGQQGGAGTGSGGTDGDAKDGNNQENEKDSSKPKGDVGQDTKPAVSEAEGAQDANVGGTGDSSNGHTENDNNKTTGTQPSPTTEKVTEAGDSSQQSDLTNGGGNGGGA